MKNAVYILHGWAIRSGNLNEEKWNPFIEQLKKNNDLNVIFLKIPGLSAPLNEVWDLDDFVHWLEIEVNKKSEDDKVILIGHSFGGQIAIRFTAKNPDRVSKLVLIDSAGIRDMSARAIIKRTAFLILAKVGKILFKASLFRDLLYKFAREDDYKNAPPLLRRTMSQILDDEIVDDLPKVCCQTKIIWGEADMSTPVKHAYQMQKTIKNSELFFVKDARHSPQFTHVAETAKVVGEFLK